MNMRLLLALTGLALGLTLPALAQRAEPSPSTQAQPKEAAPSAQERQQIDALATRYAEAANRHDAAGIAALFTEDGVLVSPKGIHSGRQAIEQFYRDTFNAAAVSGAALQTTELHGMGDLAWAVGQWRNNTEQGNWGSVDERRGGAWQLRMLSFNTTPPEAVPTTPASSPRPRIGFAPSTAATGLAPSPMPSPTATPSSR
jgi:ketosteroid isomerase-like protein